MTTRVANLRLEKYDVYIGRPGKGQAGEFGNPVRPGNVCPVCKMTHLDGPSTLPCFEKYLAGRMEDDSVFKTRVLALKDKVLGCFCRPAGGFGGRIMCHGQILAARLDGVKPEQVK